MTENKLPVPPARPPRAPRQSYPTQPPGPGPQQGYEHYKQPHYAHLCAGYPMPTVKPPSSGLRLTGGILMIVLGFLLTLTSLFAFQAYAGIEYPPFGIAGLLFAIISLGSTTTGIIVLAKHRSRTGPAPVAAIISAALAFVVSLWATVEELAGVLGLICLVAAAPAALILLGLVFLREKRTA